MVKRVKKGPPKDIDRMIGKQKAVTAQDTLVKGIRKVTVKRAPSKTIEVTKKRALAVKKDVQIKSQKAIATSRQARMKAFDKQTRVLTKKVVRKKPTNVTVKLKETSIRSQAKLKSLETVRKYKSAAFEKKVKTDIKVQQKLKSLRSTRDDNILPSKLKSTKEDGTSASMKHKDSTAKKKQASDNFDTSKKNIKDQFKDLNDVNTKTTGLKKKNADNENLNGNADQALKKSKADAEAAKTKAKKAADDASTAKKNIDDLDANPLVDKTPPKNPAKDAANDAGTNADIALEKAKAKKIAADKDGTDVLDSGVNKKLASNDIDANSPGLNDTGNPVINAKRSQEINGDNINKIKNDPDSVKKHKALRDDAADAQKAHKSNLDDATTKRSKAENDLADTDASINKKKAELEAAQKKQTSADADHERAMNKKNDIDNKLNELNLNEKPLKKARDDAENNVKKNRPDSPDDVDSQLETYKKKAKDSQDDIDENNKNIDAEKAKKKKKPDDPTDDVDAANKKLRDDDEAELKRKKQLEDENKDIDDTNNDAGQERQKGTLMQGIVGTLAGNLVGNYTPPIPIPWGGPGQDPTSPPKPQDDIPTGSTGDSIFPEGPTTPTGPTVPTVPTGPAVPTGPTGITVLQPTGDDMKKVYDAAYANGLAAGRKDGQAEGTKEAYSRVNKIPTASESRLLGQLKGIDSTDINKEASAIQEEAYCKEIIPEALKLHLDIVTSFPGCVSYTGVPGAGDSRTGDVGAGDAGAGDSGASGADESDMTVGGYKEENGIMIPSYVQHGGVIDPSNPTDSGYKDGYSVGYSERYTLYLTLIKMILKTKGITLIEPIELPAPVKPLEIEPSESGPSGPAESGASGSSGPAESGASGSQEGGFKAAKKAFRMKHARLPSKIINKTTAV